jgi:uncharacterized protein (DUF1800 family)
MFEKMKSTPVALSLLLLAACGGGSDSANPTAAQGGAQLLASVVSSTDTATAPASPRVRSGGSELSATATSSTTPAAAAHLLTQASFGVTDASLADVVARGPAGWIENQFTLPQTSHLATMQAFGSSVRPENFYESFWKQATLGNDQLRQRVAYALSQIFVVSAAESHLASQPLSLGSYYDMLGKYAFGNYRDLLEAMALHPAMGVYLNSLRNQKEDGPRLPDENFARELMQLMTIGLYELNPDGSWKTHNGLPMETYTSDDIKGLAKVFTGWSFAGPDTQVKRFFGSVADTGRDWLPMQNYPDWHSTSEKRFLWVSIGSGSSGQSDLKLALDRLFTHRNAAPFFSKQLIQRMVTSNPSTAYVGRVAAAFVDNGAGVRGDMKAIIRAVLLDPEAAGVGLKLREPVIRMANWMRAFKATSASGRFLMPTLDDPLNGLNQNPLRSPTVFNFYRPTYTPPNSTLSAAGMVAPEMQITSEPSVTGYLNLMRNVIPDGIGTNHDVLPNYSSELALATQPTQLVDRVNLLLLNGAMSADLRRMIEGALNAVPIPALTSSDPSVIEAKKNRVCLAIYLAMASPEYLVQ